MGTTVNTTGPRALEQEREAHGKTAKQLADSVAIEGHLQKKLEAVEAQRDRYQRRVKALEARLRTIAEPKDDMTMTDLEETEALVHDAVQKMTEAWAALQRVEPLLKRSPLKEHYRDEFDMQWSVLRLFQEYRLKGAVLACRMGAAVGAAKRAAAIQRLGGKSSLKSKSGG